MDHPEEITTPAGTEKESLSRRELLKALAAAGGAVAATSLVPRKWSKPEVGMGVLPAHAQGSQPSTQYALSCAVMVQDQFAGWIPYDGRTGNLTLRAEVTLTPPDVGILVNLELFVNATKYSEVVPTNSSGVAVGSTRTPQIFNGDGVGSAAFVYDPAINHCITTIIAGGGT